MIFSFAPPSGRHHPIATGVRATVLRCTCSPAEPAVDREPHLRWLRSRRGISYAACVVH